MKCNLVPPEMQRQRKEVQKQRLIMPGVWILVSVIIISGGLAVWCFTTTQAAKQYMTDFVYPVSQEIQQHNAAEKEAKQYQKALMEASKQGIHWSAVLVMLADTKPARIEIFSLSGSDGSITITAQSQRMEEARAWQQLLKRKEGIANVQLKTMKQSSDGPKQVVLAMHLGDKQHGTTTPSQQ